LGVVAILLFPGWRLLLAFTVATGIGRDALQSRIDAVEAKAILREQLTTDDREFLVDFYATLATGGKLSILARQTGKMMEHYLGRSGTPFELEPEIFTENDKVRAQAELLRKRVAKSRCEPGKRFSSATFYMPDASKVDSVFGLYHGQLHVTLEPASEGSCRLRWRAEVPWVWPSYELLKKKYGNAHAESFPLPNLGCLVFGREHALFVDNGLGHHLEEVGLAKSFVAFSEWVD
jgi:hypothetical protein